MKKPWGYHGEWSSSGGPIPTDLPRHSFHHDSPSAFQNNVPLYSVQCTLFPVQAAPALLRGHNAFPLGQSPAIATATAQLYGPCREAWSVVCGGKSAVSAAAAWARMREGDSSAARLAGVWLLLLQGLVMVRANTQVTVPETRLHWTHDTTEK